MTLAARLDATLAERAIILGDYAAAQKLLRSSLRGCTHPRAHSKIMLALRMVAKLLPIAE